MPSNRVVVLIRRLGPYHTARLNALGERLGAGNVLAIEVCRRDSVYAWGEVESGLAFDRTTLFADESSAEPVATLWRRLEGVLDEAAPAAALVPGWSDPASLGILRYCRRRGIPSVMMSDSTEGDSRRVWWREEIKRRVVLQADAMLVAGSRHVVYAERLGMPRSRITTGYDVVDNEFFWAGAERARRQAEVARARLGLPDTYFLTCSRFVEKKNQLRMISAYADYRRTTQARPFSMVMLGDGPLREQCARLIAELGLTGHVQLPGFRQYEELPGYYGLAAAFVHPSKVDQWGLVVNEAAAAGLPLLVSEACGCAPDLVRESENGWTFDPTDPVELAGKLARLGALSDAERRTMGDRSREVVRDWAPQRFVQGATEAIGIARRSGSRRRNYLDLALLRALAGRRVARGN